MTLETRRLGHSELVTPVVGLGTWGLCDNACGPVSDAQVARTLERALELGITLFDMAPTWGPARRSETSVASAVGERRDELLYVTRAGRLRTEHGPVADFSAEGIRTSCLRSLEHLKTDRVDVLLLHNPDADVLHDPAVSDVCDALKDEGRVRLWGASVSDEPAARGALAAGAQLLCVPHNLVRPELVWSLEHDITSRGVGVMASSPLAYGLLSGRWSAHKGFASSDHRQRRWTREALSARVAETQALRKRLVGGDVASLASAALRFAVSEPCVQTTLLGARTPGQVELSLRSLGEPPYLAEAVRSDLRERHGPA